MPARIHPLSLALGVAFAAIAFLSMSQATVINSPVRVQYMPHPKDMVQIKEGTPYTVPAGKVFVLTALGVVGAQLWSPQLSVNGQVELFWPTTHVMDEVPSGFTVPAGGVITLGNTGPTTPGRAWGYLANQ